MYFNIFASQMDWWWGMGMGTLWVFIIWLRVLHQVCQYCHTILCVAVTIVYIDNAMFDKLKINHNCLEIAVSNRKTKTNIQRHMQTFPSFLPIYLPLFISIWNETIILYLTNNKWNRMKYIWYDLERTCYAGWCE